MVFELFESDFIRLITFRAAIAAVISFVVCVFLFPPLIRLLRAKKVGDTVVKDESQKLDELQRWKRGTPTMGGLLVVTAATFALALVGNFRNPILFVLLFLLGAMCALGFVDDWTKITGKRKAGISPFAKLLGQVFVAYAVAFGAFYILKRFDPVDATKVFLPFGLIVDLGDLYPVYLMLAIVAFSNAVNITDGLDGLAAGCYTVAIFAFGIVCYIAGRADFSSYLGLPHIVTASELSVFCAAMFGACLGFLWFNCYPAQIFMGDTGSLALGGALGFVACVAKQEYLLLLVGAVFILEFMSSFLQIASFKLFKKRLFPIAPLHHTFQFKGYTEAKITVRFWIVSVILAILALATFKLR